ncbi:MAG: dihydroneopterin aldolase [Actinomycetota bacterium]|jgi:dihydroneopterin aldolase|nr:dihydroneopterin aldolase [Actinomycetota bacterium]
MATSDRVLLNGLRVLGCHGVTDEERQLAQPFEVDVELEVDLTDSSTRDDLDCTVDYAVVAAKVDQVVSSSSYRLLESLAGAIAKVVLDLPHVEAITVEIRKLRPPMPYDASSVGVRLRREACTAT